jgi:hypothetical protein
MKKAFVISLGLMIFIVSVAFTSFDPPGFKNLKVLPRYISEPALDSIMHFYSVSLNVGCDFCHVHDKQKDTWDMASDAKGEKLITRKMMLMTNGINGMYFPPEKGVTDPHAMQTVTCFTCHKGEAIPIDMPQVKTDSTIKK